MESKAVGKDEENDNNDILVILVLLFEQDMLH